MNIGIVDVLLLLALNCAKSISEPITMCYKPKFFTENNCGNSHAIPSTFLEASESIAVDVSKMPFDSDLWLHIDVMPSTYAVNEDYIIKIQFAMIQITDIENRFLGRVAEQVPCNVQNYLGGHQYLTGEMRELYSNPGRKRIHVFECPFSEDLSFNVNPTVAVLEFTKPVEAFYVNIKLTKTEMECIRDEATNNRISITTILVDESGSCYLHRLNNLEALPPTPLVNETAAAVEVPILCHSTGPSLKDKTGDTGPFIMDKNYNPTFSDLQFIDQSLVKPRLPSQMPRILRELWKQAVNYHNLRVYNMDPQGFIRGETSSGGGSSIVTRNENVELVLIEKDGADVKNLPLDEDDEICDDELRNKTTENIDDTISQFYRKCGYLMGCIGEPDDCMENRNCRLLVGWSKFWDQVQFEVLIARRVYVAVGISKDVKMGEDSVTECVRENGKVYGYTSWNYNRKGVKGNKRMRSCEAMQGFEGGIQDSYDFLMYCSWKRPSVTKVKGMTFDLSDPHYLLIAEGDYSSSGVLGSLGKHDESHVFSDALVLNDYYGKSPVEYWFAKIHGFLMIFAWLFMAPVASFTARYLKGTFTDRRIYRYKYTFWFGIHGTLAGATICMTLTSVILLMAVDAHWIYEPVRLLSAHSILGFLIFFLLLAQMGLAYNLVKRPEKYKKLHLNFVHGVVGHVLVLCGFACVYTSKYERDGMDCDAAYVMIGYLACYFIIHAFMSYQVCFTDFLTGKQTSRVYKVFLIDKPEDDTFDEPGSPARKVVFIVLVAVLAVFNLYFLIMAFHPAALDCASKDAMKPPNVLTIGLLQ